MPILVLDSSWGPWCVCLEPGKQAAGHEFNMDEAHKMLDVQTLGRWFQFFSSVAKSFQWHFKTWPKTLYYSRQQLTEQICSVYFYVICIFCMLSHRWMNVILKKKDSEGIFENIFFLLTLTHLFDLLSYRSTPKQFLVAFLFAFSLVLFSGQNYQNNKYTFFAIYLC